MRRWNKTLRLMQAGLRQRFQSCACPGERILVVQFASLGDTALLLSVLQNLRRSGLQVDGLCLPSMAPLWKHVLPDARVVPVEPDLRNPKELYEALAILDEEVYAHVFITRLNIQSVFAASAIRTMKRWGLQEAGKNSLILRLFVNGVYTAGQNVHVMDRYSSLFRLGGIVTGFHSSKKETSMEISRVLIHPGAKWVHRRWPAERFGELARVLSDLGMRVSVVVHEDEKKLLAAFSGIQERSKVTIIRTKELEDLIWAVEQADLLIGNDSGPVHLANLMNKPVICIWGPGNLDRIRPLGDVVRIVSHSVPCRPCIQYRIPQCGGSTGECLQAISVQDVLRAFQNLFEHIRNNK